MTDHVAVGKVKDNRIIFFALDRINNLVRHLVCAHFGLHIVGRYFRGSNKDSVLALVLLFNAAVEEERHMSVLLGLCDSKLCLAVF